MKFVLIIGVMSFIAPIFVCAQQGPNLLLELQAIRQEIAELRDMVERQDHQLWLLKKQLSDKTSVGAPQTGSLPDENSAYQAVASETDEYQSAKPILVVPDQSESSLVVPQQPEAETIVVQESEIYLPAQEVQLIDQPEVPQGEDTAASDTGAAETTPQLMSEPSEPVQIKALPVDVIAEGVVGDGVVHVPSEQILETPWSVEAEVPLADQQPANVAENTQQVEIIDRPIETTVDTAMPVPIEEIAVGVNRAQMPPEQTSETPEPVEAKVAQIEDTVASDTIVTETAPQFMPEPSEPVQIETLPVDVISEGVVGDGAVQAPPEQILETPGPVEAELALVDQQEVPLTDQQPANVAENTQQVEIIDRPIETTVDTAMPVPIEEIAVGDNRAQMSPEQTPETQEPAKIERPKVENKVVSDAGIVQATPQKTPENPVPVQVEPAATKEVHQPEQSQTPVAGVIQVPQNDKELAGVHKSAKEDTPENEQVLYQRGFVFLKELKYEQAEEAFNKQISSFPQGDFADDAHYWIAESKYVNRQLDDSKKYYKLITKGFRGSPRLPDAMLKTAFIEQEQGDVIEARILLQEVVKYYPRSNAAISAKNRLAELK